MPFAVDHPPGTHVRAPGPVRLLVVDDHEVVRQGLAAALAADGRYEIVGGVASAAAALEAARRTSPHIALIDLRLPDMMGDELCRELRARCPATAVVVLSSYVSEDTVRATMEAGASAYVAKAAGLAELRKALDRVLGAQDEGGERPIVAQLRELVARRADDGVLTPQQQRVLELAADGLTYREIGERMYISESTVRFHMQKLKGRLGARSKADSIAKAIRSGVIAPADERARPR